MTSSVVVSWKSKKMSTVQIMNVMDNVLNCNHISMYTCIHLYNCISKSLLVCKMLTMHTKICNGLFNVFCISLIISYFIN